jgi:competence protein CoiA
MLLFALDSNNQSIDARYASKQKNYFCLECQQIVRMRGGPHRRCHFYHLEPTIFCRQHQKGLIHLQLQSYFLQHLTENDCRLEFHFPSIQRIADVAWLSKKLIFEIQCSPISAEEVLARNRAYAQEGWSVVWILHDQRYNQKRLTAAEIALRSSTYFYTNMNQVGAGFIYDQFDICHKGIRQNRLPPLSIDFKEPFACEAFRNHASFPLEFLANRAKNWKYFFHGDLLHLFINSPLANYLQEAIEKEKRFLLLNNTSFSWNHLPTQIWQRGFAIPYQLLFRYILEKVCR